ncbi:MAG: serine/threonine protein kinase [Tannerella sp.]|jgi:serine/threonine protein kinase|nr:serine/threonine protein kinase [Tannerella sp.]
MLREHTLVKERYLLLRILGKGGFSEVWLADDMWTSTQVALKFYASGGGLDEEGIRLFTHEFALLFDLNHSNLLKPSHYDHYENMPFLVLAYCEKGSAFKLISRIDEKEAWLFIRDVSEGLHYLHSNKPPIIHQDIKPDNILIDRNGRFVITDFGISTRIRNTLRGSATSMLATGGGTLAYMPPERFGDDPLLVRASDIWSLGATMFELLTGNVPFGEYGGLLQKNGADIPKIKENYSNELKKIVYQCLAKETWERPTALDLSNRAKSMLEGEKIQGVDHKKFIVWLVAGLSAIVLIIAAFFIENKFSGDFKQNEELSQTALSQYNHYIHRGDSLHGIGLKKEIEFELKYVDALKNYQNALKAVEKIDDLLKEKDQAREKIDGVKKLILTAYEDFLYRAERMKERNQLPAAKALSERANFLRDFVEEEHVVNN